MAKIENGILGTVTGKVGAVIAQRWKGKNIVKGYRKMKYPGYPDQVAQNDIFRYICDIGKINYMSLIKLTFLSGTVGKDFSPWNLLMKVNRQIPDLLANKDRFQISYGSLKTAPVDDFNFNFVTKRVTIDWDQTVSGNASGSDRIYIYVLFANSKNLILVSDESVKRSDSFIKFDNQNEAYWTGSIAYVFAQNSDGVFSNTTGRKILKVVP
jgi:hypothetical protein